MPNNGYQITLTSSLPMFLFCNLGLSNEQRELISFLSVIATESVRVVMPKNIKFKNQEAFIAALFKPGLEAAHSCTDGYSSKFTIDNPTLVLPEEYFSACSDRGAIEEQLAVMGVHTKFPIDFTPFDRMPISSDRLINLFHKLELLEESLLALDSGTDQASKLEGVMQEIEMEQKRLEGFRPDQARHCLRFQILPSYPIY